jgi:hypothetical protein
MKSSVVRAGNGVVVSIASTYMTHNILSGATSLQTKTAQSAAVAAPTKGIGTLQNELAGGLIPLDLAQIPKILSCF